VRNCGWHGHVTWAPTEEELADRLSVDTVHGEAWRCLRCGTYVLGDPHGRGPAEQAPLVMRGRALRDAFILRLLALERGIRGVLLVALATGSTASKGPRTPCSGSSTSTCPGWCRSPTAPASTCSRPVRSG
jgi:hypothetical protein